jgi:hypothetical protein
MLPQVASVMIETRDVVTVRSFCRKKVYQASVEPIYIESKNNYKAFGWKTISSNSMGEHKIGE